jgi:hypothetical protein
MKTNKKYYEQAKSECEDLVMELMNGIKTFDNSIKILPPKDLMFRLNKTRGLALTNRRIIHHLGHIFQKVKNYLFL